MTMQTEERRENIRRALGVLGDGELPGRAVGFFNALGYASERTLELDGSPRGFVARYPTVAGKGGTKTEQEFLAAAELVHIVFQVTNDEIQTASQVDLLESDKKFDTELFSSFLYVAVQLKSGRYARGKYAEMAREVNKRFRTPVVVMFIKEDKMTLAFVYHRKHKQHNDRNVLGKVSLIREVVCADPHRAHLDILAELSLDDRLGWMEQNNKPKNFDGLLAGWLAKLDTQELNKRFYKDLFDWFQWAVWEARFPTLKDAQARNKILKPEEHVIRLITRVLFVWFIKEKGLVVDDLFVEEKIRGLLKGYDRDKGASYYRAVLQNLFFATLNTEIPKRAFSGVDPAGHRDFSRYRYKSQISDPAKLLGLFSKTPFINGGLFDCLDSEEAQTNKGYRIDCFSDKHYKLKSVPNRLFFDDEKGLFTVLNKYKFTVEENTPVEQEVALDPELLGNVFENLLAAYNPETRGTARKQTGSYYTPRAIVDYMVDEGLVAVLAEKCQPSDGNKSLWRERLHYLLDYAYAFGGAKVLFDEAEVKQIVRAISKVKVLDPAVGSGAFPMGVLHKLTLALRRIDPDNTLWEKLQTAQAKERAGAAIDTRDSAARASELKEISDTFEVYKDSDFGRKLYLIQNSIFGVDIQPVACQIAKLRFFISLAIEQEASDCKTDNYGIKPLPNLETRFVAADTLIGLRLADRGALQFKEIKQLEEKLAQNREQHFNAKTRRIKLACSQRDKKLRGELATELAGHYQRDAAWDEMKRIVDTGTRKLIKQLANHELNMRQAGQGTLLQSGKRSDADGERWQGKIDRTREQITESEKLLAAIANRDAAVQSGEEWHQAEQAAEANRGRIHGEAQKIADWDPYDQNAHADWFDPEWMFGVRDGFDLVIGNPPYINVESMAEKSRRKIMSIYATCERRTDIYIAFFEKSLSILNANGIVTFIVPHSFTTQKYGEKMRQLMVDEHAIQEIVDASSYKIFENATVFNVVMRIGKGNGVKTLIRHHRSNNDFRDPPKGFFISQVKFANMKEHRLETRKSIFDFQPLKQKIWNKSCPLQDICLVAYGARLNHKTKKIGKENYISKQYIAGYKKFTEGRNIERYYFNESGWLNYRPDEHYNPMFRELFESEKLMLIRIVSDRLRFAHDVGGYYNSHTVINCVRFDFLENETHVTASRAIKNNDINFAKKFNYKFLLGILNSSLINWYFLSFLSDRLNCYPEDVKHLPIPIVSEKVQSKIVELTDKIIVAKNSNPTAETVPLETEIDNLIYKLYGLTSKEVKIIENA